MTTNFFKFVLSLITTSIFIGGNLVYGQQRQPVEYLDTLSIVITYRIGQSVIVPTLGSNSTELAKLDRFMNDWLTNIDPNDPITHTLDITGVCSVDGSYKTNVYISQMRAIATRRWLERHYTFSKNVVLRTFNISEDWDGFIALVKSSGDVYTNQMLSIIEKEKDFDKRERSLRALAGGAPWRRMMEKMGDSRSTHINLVSKRTKKERGSVASTARSSSILEHEYYVPLDQELYKPRPLNITPISIPNSDWKIMRSASKLPTFESTTTKGCGFFPFALKTNLLFDAVTALNVELEVPITPHFSLAAEYVFPWWLTKGHNYCFQLIYGTLEGRYWFGDRSKRGMLEGFFVGAHAGIGYYDFQSKTQGYQGEVLIGGLSAGYSIKLNRTFNLELSVGGGYIYTKYRYYIPKDDYTILAYQHRGIYGNYVPTKAKIALVWNICSSNYNRRGIR